ncbi:hypothetical protein DEO72_LG11g1012 [Vigna unguiculata]|uniref:Uncharacterized protein n=1 Tax=Vigna unguiculata TaxID=3917 RepID=A0A4D6NMX1_VIGUN|nr:hypothetical protein DEO72_LG11g1012 [Vigna unguiculata]
MLTLVVDISAHPRAAHPRAKCYKCYNVSIPHTRGHGITSRPLKHDPEISPRDLKELRTDHRPIINKQ